MRCRRSRWTSTPVRTRTPEDRCRAGVIPDPASVRTEEFVNSLDQDYAQPTDGAVRADGRRHDRAVPRPSSTGRARRHPRTHHRRRRSTRRQPDLRHRHQRVDGRPGQARRRPPGVDRSGRIAAADRSRGHRRVLRLTRGAARVDAGQRPRRPSIGRSSNWYPEGSTNVEDGLRLGYAEARRTLDTERINRVVLLSDGVANVGATGPEQILDAHRGQRSRRHRSGHRGLRPRRRTTTR